MLNIPSFQQTTGLCGPTALRMVLAFYGVEKTEDELAKLSGATPEKGVEAQGLIKAAEQCGLKGLYKDNATLNEIREYILHKKIPVIVDWFSQDDGHYSVVMDINDAHISLRDPEHKDIHTIDLSTFFRCWFDFPGDYIASKKDIILRRMIVLQSKK